MPTQTRTEQRRILAAEQPNGWRDLVWFVTAKPTGQPAYAAAYPSTSIPVIAVAPDPEITRHWAHLLQELFRSAEPSWSFGVDLTNIRGLEQAGVKWYWWGELDQVCDGCGAVGWDSCCCVSNAWIVANAPGR